MSKFTERIASILPTNIETTAELPKDVRIRFDCHRPSDDGRLISREGVGRDNLIDALQSGAGPLLMVQVDGEYASLYSDPVEGGKEGRGPIYTILRLATVMALAVLKVEQSSLPEEAQTYVVNGYSTEASLAQLVTAAKAQKGAKSPEERSAITVLHAVGNSRKSVNGIAPLAGELLETCVDILAGALSLEPETVETVAWNAFLAPLTRQDPGRFMSDVLINELELVVA